MSREVVRSPVVRVVESDKGILYIREVHVERPIGFDVKSKAMTSEFTIMSDRYGNLVTTFPGKLGR